jgi:nucleotide-binding universal stress UspA family protein
MTAAPFTSILCGVDGNPSSTEAARQAITLASSGAELRFIAVHASFELGPDYTTKEKLQEALDEAARLASEAGVSAQTEMKEGRYAAKVLLAEGDKHDLLVIGTHGRSRVVSILLGSTASESAHETERPLLIAREPPNSGGLSDGILFASDGAEDSWAPARMAAALAATSEAELKVIHVEDGKHPEADEVLSAQVAEIEALTGGKPELLKTEGKATEQIVKAAKEEASSLIVCGRRGVTGIKRLGSVSERVVHQAGSSVLLVPGD